MEDVKKMDQLRLIDMLSKYTEEYMHIFKYGESTRDEYAKCRQMIEKISREIESRKQGKKNIR